MNIVITNLRQSERAKKSGRLAGRPPFLTTHCSNPEVRIPKILQPKFEAAVKTHMKRARGNLWPRQYLDGWILIFFLAQIIPYEYDRLLEYDDLKCLHVCANSATLVHKCS